MGMKFQDSTYVVNQTWDSSTAQNTTLQAYEWGYCTALITVQNTGSITGGAIGFQGWDGYNWYNIPAIQATASASAISSYTLTGGSGAFYVDVNAFSDFQVILSSAITGTGSVNVNINSSAATLGPIGSSGGGGGGGGGLSVVDEASWTAGTSNFTPTGGFFNDSATALTSGQQGTARLTADRSVYTANSQPASTTATWTTATSINVALAQSVVGEGTVTVTTVETGTTTTAGALTFEVFDGTGWYAVEGQQIGSYTIMSSYSLVNGTNVAWQFDVAGFQQFRVRLSTAITGTGSPQVVVVLQPQGAPNSITPTVGWGQRLDNVNDSITNYPFGNSAQNITTNATTTLKNGAGVFNGFTVNNNGFTTAGTITIYDNTAASGTKLGTITIPISPPGTALLATDLMPPTLGLDAAFTTGLTFVTATTAPAADITVVWR